MSDTGWERDSRSSSLTLSHTTSISGVVTLPLFFVNKLDFKPTLLERKYRIIVNVSPVIHVVNTHNSFQTASWLPFNIFRALTLRLTYKESNLDLKTHSNNIYLPSGFRNMPEVCAVHPQLLSSWVEKVSMCMRERNKSKSCGQGGASTISVFLTTVHCVTCLCPYYEHVSTLILHIWWQTVVCRRAAYRGEVIGSHDTAPVFISFQISISHLCDLIL